MEQAALPRDSFMEGIKTLTGEIVKRVKDFREAQQQVELPEMELDCPSCHAHGLKNTLDAVSWPFLQVQHPQSYLRPRHGG